MEKDKNSLLNIQKLAKMLDGNQLVTTEEFKSAVSDFINAFAQHRSAFGEISKKNDETMSTTLKNLQGEFDRVIGNSMGKEEARSMIDGGIQEIKAMVSAIQQIQGLKGENGKDGINGKDADELNIVAQVLSRIKIPKQVKPDTPDEVVDKVNSSSKKIKKERVEGLEQAIMNSANNAVQSLPVTTMFVNGKRSKNLSVTGAGATVSTAGDTTTINITSGGGSGTVTDVSVVTANGVSGSVADSTTTPAITLTLGAITPSSVAAVGTVTGSNLSNTNTGDQTSIVGITGTTAQFNTALSDNDFATLAGSEALTNKTYNGHTFTAGSSTFTGTAGQTYTFPSTSKTVAASDGSNLGVTSQATGDLIVATAATTVGRVADVAVGQVLVSGGVGVAPSYSATPLVTSLDLGATDTTISKSSAGVIAVEGVVIPSISSTNTLTNKRMQVRTASSTTSANLSPDLSTANVYFRTTQTATLTIDAPTGTPVIGEVITLYVDSAGAQTLTINSTYKAFGAAFPATTTAGKTFMMTAMYNGTDWKTTWSNAV